VTFLLRTPSVFDHDDVVQKFVKDGKACLVKGDALVKADVAKAWEEAAKGDGEQHVDILLFTVGGTPKFSLRKGFIVTPSDLVTKSFLNAITSLPLPPSGQTTKIITVSTMGLSKKAHAALPFALKPLYSYALDYPHRDKRGLERLAAHCAGWEWDDGVEGAVSGDVLASGWQDAEGLPAPGSLKSIVVLRPALFVDGECKADKIAAAKSKKEPYRVTVDDITGWTITRKDVAHFVVEGVLADWEKWQGKRISMAY